MEIKANIKLLPKVEFTSKCWNESAQGMQEIWKFAKNCLKFLNVLRILIL